MTKPIGEDNRVKVVRLTNEQIEYIVAHLDQDLRTIPDNGPANLYARKMVLELHTKFINARPGHSDKYYLQRQEADKERRRLAREAGKRKINGYQ